MLLGLLTGGTVVACGAYALLWLMARSDELERQRRRY
jgi:hypothetical protein